MDTSRLRLYTNRQEDRYDQPVNRRAALFLLLYVAAILYLSLYPWRFVPNPGPRTLGWVPIGYSPHDSGCLSQRGVLHAPGRGGVSVVPARARRFAIRCCGGLRNVRVVHRGVDPTLHPHPLRQSDRSGLQQCGHITGHCDRLCGNQPSAGLASCVSFFLRVSCCWDYGRSGRLSCFCLDMGPRLTLAT